MERRGHWGAWRLVLERAIATARRVDDLDGETTMTALLARLSQRQSRPQEMARYYRRVIRLAKRTGIRFEEARACSNLGFAYIDGGHWWRAEVLCCHALAVFEALGSEHGLAHTHNHLGLLYTRQHKWPVAEQHLQDACALWEEMNDQHALIYGFENLGVLYYEMNRPDDALALFEKSIQQGEQTGEYAESSKIQMNLGLVYQQKGDLEKAEHYFMLAEQSFKQNADLLGLAQVWGNWGELYLRQEKWSDARQQLESSLKMCRTLNHHQGEAKVLMNLITYHWQQLDRMQAIAHLQELEELLLRQQWGMHEEVLKQEVLNLKERLMS
jgi:tetratricopeptide (TPR) repeat protein